MTTPLPQDNLRKEFVNRWKKPGDEAYTNIPGLKTDTTPVTEWWEESQSASYKFGGNIYEMYDNSNLRVARGDYLRMSSLSLRYNVNDNLCKKLRLKSAYVSLTGTNIFTITSKELRGQDPTQSGTTPSVNISVRPSFSCNINVTF